MSGVDDVDFVLRESTASALPNHRSQGDIGIESIAMQFN